MKKNPVKAIREFCVDACCCGSTTTVRDCTAAWCPLYAFRFGTNPYRSKRELTEEQREAAKVRLAEARSKKAVELDEQGDFDG